MSKKKKLNKIEHNGFVFVEDGTVYSTVSMREVASRPRTNGHRYLSLPTGGSVKLEYLMAALFLNNGEFPKRFDQWTVKFKDNDPTNCAVSNLELIKTPSKKKGRPKGNGTYYCLIDLVDNDWDELSIEGIANKLNISVSTVRAYLNSDPKKIYNNRYIIGDLVDVWENLD
jgi:hypothetical protein